MKLDDLLHQDSEWLSGNGPNSDIVFSSRIRLARNIENMPYSHWANKKQQEEVLTVAKEAIEGTDYMKGGLFLKLKDLSNIDKEFLVERHLINH